MSQPNIVVEEFRKNVDTFVDYGSYDYMPGDMLKLHAPCETYSGVTYSHIQPSQSHILGLYIPNQNFETWATMSEYTEVAPRYIGRLCLSSSKAEDHVLYRSIRIKGLFGDIDDIDIKSTLNEEEMELGLEWMASPILRKSLLPRLMKLSEVDIEKIDSKKDDQKKLEKELRLKYPIRDDEYPGFFDDTVDSL